MPIPDKYSWLKTIIDFPRTITVGLELLGTQEIIGKGSCKTIMSWRDELNGATYTGQPIVSGYSDDSVPWCGLFAAIVCFRRSGILPEVVKDPLWARNWAKYGVKATKAELGDILVFVRDGGGHVGFYIAEDVAAYHVLGGNQSDSVSITRIAKDRCIAIRRPKYTTKPDGVKSYIVSATGKISTNEA